jgi:hypothetical protein
MDAGVAACARSGSSARRASSRLSCESSFAFGGDSDVLAAGVAQLPADDFSQVPMPGVRRARADAA